MMSRCLFLMGLLLLSCQATDLTGSVSQAELDAVQRRRAWFAQEGRYQGGAAEDPYPPYGEGQYD